MVRSNLLNSQRQRLRDEQEEAELESLASARNSAYQTRLEQTARRGFIVERGINVAGLQTTTIPATIDGRNWTHFTHTREPYHPGLVREFYASMVPVVFRNSGCVWVQGVQVEITSTAINEYLQTMIPADEDFNEGYPVAADFYPELSEMAAALRHDQSNVWVPGTTDLCHGDLLPDMAFWAVFISHSIVSSSHRTKISIENARLLHAIQSDVTVDVGHFIFQSILKTGCSPNCLLGFPCLITHFCRRAGIAAAFDEADLVAPPSDICKKTYNSFCSRHGFPNVTDGGRYRNRSRRTAEAQHQAQPQVAAQPRQPRQPRQPQQQNQDALLAAIQEVRTTQLAHGAILERVAGSIPSSSQPPSNPPYSEPRSDHQPSSPSEYVPQRRRESPLRPNRFTHLFTCFYTRRRRRGGAGASSSRQPQGDI